MEPIGVEQMKEVSLKKPAQLTGLHPIQGLQMKVVFQAFRVATVTALEHSATLEATVTGGRLLSTLHTPHGAGHWFSMIQR